MGKVAAIDGLTSGLYDGMYAQPAGIEDGNKAIIRINSPIAHMNYLVFAIKGLKKRFTTWNDLNGHRVGFLQQRPYMAENLPHRLKGVIRKHTWPELLQSLHNGECDVILRQTVLDNDFVVPDYIENVGRVDRAPAFIYVNEQHAGLAVKLENILNSMRTDGTIEKILRHKMHGERDIKLVLHISSYSSEAVWEQKIVEGINSIFYNDKNITYYSIMLNSRHILDEERRYNIALNIIRNYFMSNNVDAIIVSDNDALRFVSLYYNILFTGVPIVFCGVNDFDNSMLGGIRTNISGIVEKISARQNVEQMLTLFPKTKKIFIVNDYTETGRLWQRDTEQQLAPYAGRVDIAYNDDVSFTELFAQVAALGEDALVLAGAYFIDAEERYMPQEEFQHKLTTAARGPVFSFFDGTQGMGSLGGRYTNGIHQGRTAAGLVQRLLRGEALPPIIRDPEENNRWIFDYPLLEKFNIEISRLPEGSIILNKPPSLREMNPLLFWQLVWAGVSCILIIVIMAFSITLLRRQNKKLHGAERAAQEVKDRIQKLIESAPITYGMLVDGVVVENNTCHRELTGTRSGDNIHGKYAGRGWDMREYDAAVSDVLQGRETVRRFPWKVVNKEGELRRYIFNMTAAEYEGKKATVIWGMDVEEMAQQRDALALANQSLQQVIESTPIPIVLFEPVQRLVIMANEAWANLYRFKSKEETTGFVLKESFGVPSIAKELRDALLSDEILSWDCKFRTWEGTMFDAIVYTKKIVYNTMNCLVVCVRDQSEEKLRARLLQSATDKEREASRLKSQFVMNMSHEIRTPMNAVIGMTRIAKQTDDFATVRKCVESIEEASSHLMGIIDDVLDLSMIEDGKLKLRPEEIPLAQTVASVLAMLRPEADEHEVTLSSDLAALGDDVVIADASRLGQVLINLVSNSIKFNQRGGSVSVTAQTPARQGGRAKYRFSVTDTGIGIPAAKLDRLFTPFEQMDGGMTRRHGGTGLGLVLAKNIVSMMGGTIKVTSEEGAGSTFSFTIAVPLVEKTLHPHENIAAGEEPPLDFSAMRALIVDDVELNRIIAETLFSDLGLKVELAEDGRQALDMVAASTPGYYDFVLMDMQMPELDGCSATKAIRQLDRPDAAALPVIAMTANVTKDDIAMCLESGMNGHIGKPINLDNAISAVTDILRGAGGRS